jgi:hypothetical protein
MAAAARLPEPDTEAGMEYLDFTLQIDAGRQEGTYVARVLHSPAGEGEGEFRVPVDLEDLEILVKGVAEGGAKVEALLQSVGVRLFRELFSDRIRARFAQSRGNLQDREGWGLRFRIQLGLDLPEVALLHALPWEYLYDASSRRWLARGRDISIARYIHVDLPGDRPPLPPPLRILAVACEPAGFVPLDLSGEYESLRRAWEGSGVAEVSILRHATLDRLREELLSRHIHVLHFMGHGSFHAGSGEGEVVLEDGNGRAAYVDGPALADQLRDCTSLRLIFLNVCHTARAAAPAPFAGVATALLQAGIPAVIAMQFPITDEAALAFSEAVYHRLAAGDSMDAAVAEGRLAILRRMPDSLEWGTPVLFLRAADSRLLRPSAAPAELPVRPRRRWGAAAGAVILVALGSLAALAQWRESRVAETRQEEKQEKAPAAVPTPTPEPLAKPAPSLPKKLPVETPVQEPQKPATIEKPAPRLPASYTLADGDTVYLDDIGVTASVQFHGYGGEAFANLTLSSDRTEPVYETLMGSGSVTIPTDQGSLHVDVLNVDLEGRSLTLKSRGR